MTRVLESVLAVLSLMLSFSMAKRNFAIHPEHGAISIGSQNDSLVANSPLASCL